MSVIKRQQRPFIDRVKVGKYGEDVVIQFFNRKGYKFIDVRDIPYYQSIEIDFIVEIDGVKHTVEVKTSEENIHKYNSIMVKLYTEYDDKKEYKKRGNDAYMFRTKAQFLFYVDCVSNDILIVKTAKLKDYINANKYSLNIRQYHDCEKDLKRQKYNRINTVAYIPISNLSSLKRIVNNHKLDLKSYNISSKRQ